MELVKTICKLLDETVPLAQSQYEDLITFVTDRPGHDHRYAINATKIENDLDWTPSIGFNDGFEITIKWYLDNEWWWRPLVAEGAFGKRLGSKPT